MTKFKYLNIFFKARIKIAVATCIKNERPYIREWIDHYRSLGFDRIFIYDNDSTDETQRLVTHLSGADVEIIPWPTPVCASPQLTAFEHCATKAIGKFDFVAFFDADELLTENTSGDLRRILTNLNKNIEGVLINQRVVGSNGNRIYYPSPVKYRFPALTTENYMENVWVKSVVRPSSILRFNNPHIPKTKLINFADGNGKSLSQDEIDIDGRISTVSHATLALNHYILKSYEEFLWKRNRGGGAGSTPASRKERYDDHNFFHHREISIKSKSFLEKTAPLTAEQAVFAINESFKDLSQFKVTLNHASIAKIPSGQREWLLRQSRTHNSVVHFGITEATVDAIYCGIENIVVVHSNRDVVNSFISASIVAAAIEVGRLNVIYVDIGPVNEFGTPTDFSHQDNFHKYSEIPWEILAAKKASKSPPLVLISGRFRVACAGVTGLKSRSSQIMLRDAMRPEYASLYDFFSVEQTIDDAVILKINEATELPNIKSLIENHSKESM